MKLWYRIRHIGVIQLFAILVVAAATVYVVKYFGRQPATRLIQVQVTGKDWTQNYTNYNGYKAPFWLTDKIQVGDTERSVDGKTIATITAIDSYDRGTPDTDLYITLRIKGEINTRLQKFLYNNQFIEVGAPIQIHLSHALIAGQIVDDDVPQAGYPQKKLMITGRYRNAPGWVVDALTAGDTMTDGPHGPAVATVTQIETEPPTSTILFTLPQDAHARTGNMIRTSTFLENNPSLQDIVLHVTITATDRNGGWYFANAQPLKVGNIISINLSRVNLPEVEIQAIEDVTTH